MRARHLPVSAVPRHETESTRRPCGQNREQHRPQSAAAGSRQCRARCAAACPGRAQCRPAHSALTRCDDTKALRRATRLLQTDLAEHASADVKGAHSVHLADLLVVIQRHPRELPHQVRLEREPAITRVKHNSDRNSQSAAGLDRTAAVGVRRQRGQSAIRFAPPQLPPARTHARTDARQSEKRAKEGRGPHGRSAAERSVPSCAGSPGRQ